MQDAKRGFTLIELSIVLVVIGLIVGGVLVGRDLIAAAAVRAQISQIEKYQAAANTFKAKYNYLPGDIPNPYATQFGFQQRGSYGGEGDGNGLIESNWTGSYQQSNGTFPFLGEQAMFWVDLSKINLVDGSFNVAMPATVPSGGISATGVSQYFPQAKIGSGGYVYVWSGGYTWWNGGLSGDGNNYFAVSGVSGSPSSNMGEAPGVALMTVAQAYAIDKKLDDGIPQTGRIMAMDASPTGPWAAGGSVCPWNPLCTHNGGDSDSNNGGPVVNVGDINDSGLPSTQTCYQAVGGKLPEQYSITVNNGTGVNCVLSFRFQ